jgi:hypothetical protein
LNKTIPATGLTLSIRDKEIAVAGLILAIASFNFTVLMPKILIQ